jgi:pimeloyl-ACP methyl ester carboxylesterase
VVGHSEGADVAAGVGRAMADKLPGVALLSGAGITRFFDQVVQARVQTDEDVKQVFDDLIWITGPDASGDYKGASITRQLTYAVDSTPLDDLSRVKVPVFVATGTSDDKVPVLTTDAFVTELLRNRERQVTYAILPKLDHQFATADGTSHFHDVLKLVVDWAIAGASGRTVRIARF